MSVCGLFSRATAKVVGENIDARARAYTRTQFSHVSPFKGDMVLCCVCVRAALLLYTAITHLRARSLPLHCACMYHLTLTLAFDLT